MAANCVSAARSGPGPDGAGTWRIVRQRWAGLLLEDAELESSPALATVATDTVAPTPADAPATLTVHAHQPELADGDLAVRAAESATRSGGVSLATARVVVGAAAGSAGRTASRRWRSWPRCWAGWSACRAVVTSEGWRPHRAAGRPDRHQDHAGAVPRLRDQRRDPAHRQLRQRQAHRRGQLRRRRADPQPCRVRRDRRPAQGDPRAGGRDQGPRPIRLTARRAPRGRVRRHQDLWPRRTKVPGGAATPFGMIKSPESPTGKLGDR